jgi:predicted TIM-barrel fold metal-dependent hydrolase
MPIIDFHLHIGIERLMNPWVISFFAENNPDFAQHLSEEMSQRSVIEYLDSQGVEKAVVLADYAPKTTGVVTSEFVAEFCNGTDRLIPFGTIRFDDPTPPAVQAEHCIKVLGCRGIKLLPTYVHFYPADQRLLPAYEVLSALGVPVMFHTGTSVFKGSRIRYGNPLLLDDVAEDFPDLKIIICHAGRPFWYSEAEWMLRRHRNTYIDVSGIPLKRLPELFPHLERLRDRFIFGSDWPGIPSIRGQVSRIQALPFSAETIEAILWRNGARLLGIIGD